MNQYSEEFLNVLVLLNFIFALWDYNFSQLGMTSSHADHELRMMIICMRPEPRRSGHGPLRVGFFSSLAGYVCMEEPSRTPVWLKGWIQACVGRWGSLKKTAACSWEGKILHLQVIVCSNCLGLKYLQLCCLLGNFCKQDYCPTVMV
jgi:hypothetical protein